jgi:hypothetical protein
MAWTSPRTWTALERVTAALLNTHLRDNLKALSYKDGSAVPGGGYVTGGVAISYGVTFAVAPNPILTVGDDTGPVTFVVKTTSTTGCTVLAYIAGGAELGAGQGLRINWHASGEYT